MRDSNNVFHLAIPCKNLDEAFEFYVAKLGCKLARRYDDHLTLEFFGDQLVIYLAPDKVVVRPELIPWNFGVTFKERAEFDNLMVLLRIRGIPLFHGPFLRFEGKAEEHATMCVLDPSSNVLEFKHYKDPRMMY
jgi:extradiol dioxygenase family protein